MPDQHSRGETLTPPVTPPTSTVVALAIALCLVAVLIFALVYEPSERAKAVDPWGARLGAVVEDRRLAIAYWLRDAANDAATVAAFPSVVETLSAGAPPAGGAAAGADPAAHVRAVLESFAREQGYRAIALLDTAGRVVASNVAARDQGLHAVGLSRLGDGRAVADFYLEDGHPPIVVVSAPVRSRPASSAVQSSALGAVVIEADPSVWLYPLIARETAPTTTGEVLIARREGSRIVYLSPLRHRPRNGPVAFAIEAPSPRLAVVSAIEGRRGFGEYLDYRGASVYAATASVPGTSWGLVAKIDRSEVLATHRQRMLNRLGVLTGNLLAFIVFGLGVWRQRQARHWLALARAEARFAQLLEQANDAILIAGLDGRILDANSRAEAFYGYPRDELLRRSMSAIRAPRIRGDEDSTLERIRRQGSLVYETWHRRKDGTEFPVEISTRIVQLESGEAILSIVRDIAERRRMEDALRESEARYRRLAENAADIIYRVELLPGPRFTYVSPAATTITGYTPEEYYANLDLGVQLVSPDERDRLSELLETRPGESVVMRWARKGGGTIWIEQRLSVLRDESGTPVALEGIARDITDRVRLEAELRQAQKMEAVGRLAGGIAHDFNNLLTAIIGYAEMLLAGGNDRVAERDYVEEIRTAAERATALTQQMLAFSRQQVVVPRPVDLNLLIEHLERMLRRLIGENIEFRTELADGLWPVHADPAQVDQMILNLAVNARDAMPQGGRLVLRTANVTVGPEQGEAHPVGMPGDYVVLTVADTGQGMTPDVQAHIFEPFFTTKETGKGTGLGLSTVYGIVTQCGGRITVETAPGAGSEFRIFLPRSEAPLETDDHSAPRAAMPSGSETILVAEDNEAVRQLTRLTLQAAGYRVLAADDGERAIAAAREHPGPIDLLLTDVVMPGMDGRDLARALVGERPNLRVLFMSGYAAGDTTQDGAAAFMPNFLQKPFTPSRIATKVREVLDRDRPAGS